MPFSFVMAHRDNLVKFCRIKATDYEKSREGIIKLTYLAIKSWMSIVLSHYLQGTSQNNNFIQINKYKNMLTFNLQRNVTAVATFDLGDD